MSGTTGTTATAAAAAPNPKAKFLGGATPQTTKRDADALAGITLACAKDKREALKQSNMKSYLALKKEAEAALPVKFDFYKPGDFTKLDSMSEVSGVVENTRSLFRKMEEKDIVDVFTIPENMRFNVATNEWEPDDTKGMVDLKTEYSKVDEIQVRKGVAWMQQYGPTWYAENMLWSKNLILNSCQSTLRSKIEEGMDEYDPEEKGGPTAFYLMMSQIVSTSNEALRAQVSHLGTLKLSDFDGENVTSACTYINNMDKMLEDNNSKPKDFNDLVFAMFKHCSCEDFVKKIESIEGNMEEGLVNYTVPQYLKKIEGWYTRKIGASKWVAKSTKKGQNSTFTAGGRDMSKIQCLNCGEFGHMMKDCPKAIDQEAVELRKKLIFKNRDNRRDNNKKYSGKSSGSSYDKKKTDPKRQPPKNGEAHEKTFDGKALKWCGKCGRWTGHSTSEHKSKSELTNNDSNKDKDDKSESGAFAGSTALNF